jgi:Na+/H+-dicarboxylate symporter
MVHCVRALCLGILLSAGLSAANNLGNVNSLRIFKGADGKQYIEIGHTGTSLQATVNTSFTNAGTMLLSPIVIAWPADEVTSMSVMSTLQKALSCQCITFEAISGYATIVGNVTSSAPTPVLAGDYRFPAL